MADKTLPPHFTKALKSVSAKRPKTVIDHILKHGAITTEELQSQYGYTHPPRAARDVRELGIPLERFSVKNAQGRTIAAYKFGDPKKLHAKLRGRKALPKEFKQKIGQKYKGRCGICLECFDKRYLQIDHRVPYEVSGDVELRENKIEDYMLLCGSCNRSKSWSCEHCQNWIEEKSEIICAQCYWAVPEDYKHISLRQIRRIDVVWTDDEVAVFDRLRQKAKKINQSLPHFVKTIVKQNLE